MCSSTNTVCRDRQAWPSGLSAWCTTLVTLGGLQLEQAYEQMSLRLAATTALQVFRSKSTQMPDPIGSWCMTSKRPQF